MPDFLKQVFAWPTWPLVVTVVLVWGANLIFWGLVGLVRYTLEKIKLIPALAPEAIKRSPFPGSAAIVIPAHNEAPVLADTLESLKPLGPIWNVFVVSDGSTDRTAEIARGFGANVLELKTPLGKAGALEAALKFFDILNRFEAVLFVDADSRLAPDYLRKALPFFGDPRVVAVAGYARTLWQPERLSFWQKLFILHRERVYFFSQMLLKFGQTWRFANVTPIVPGFASVYKSTALRRMNLNPGGLVIEDFNATFEIHHKRLGLIAHQPTISAYTQDPDNLKDYFRQVKRWQLGLWQTIRLHGVWLDGFWLALIPLLLEVLVASLFFVLLPVAVILWLAVGVVEPAGGFWARFAVFNLPAWIFLAVFLPDYSMTLVISVAQKRPQYLAVGLGFVALRFLDSLAYLSAIPKAFRLNSDGRWTSPRRRT